MQRGKGGFRGGNGEICSSKSWGFKGPVKFRRLVSLQENKALDQSIIVLHESMIE